MLGGELPFGCLGCFFVVHRWLSGVGVGEVEGLTYLSINSLEQKTTETKLHSRGSWREELTQAPLPPPFLSSQLPRPLHFATERPSASASK